MKKSAVLFFIILFSPTAFAQKSQPIKKPTNFAKPAAGVANEKDAFAKAVNEKIAADRIKALQKFVEGFPNSTEKIRAAELITSARAEIADEKLRLGDAAGGIEFFTAAIRDAPQPVSDKLFTEILLQIPTNLFFRGQQSSAIAVAKLIEEKIEANPNQILGLATFYLGTEKAAEARRLANKAIAVNPNLPAAYQTLGLAYRLSFQLEDAAAAYAKALELDRNSAVSKRSLAEMKRANGKIDDAIQLYRELLAKDESDTAAQTGLALALFDADRRSEAEAEMQKSLGQNANNLPLLVGAAYWYAAHDDAARAIEFAQKSIAVEPRYTWSYVALARGFVQQKNLFEAEKALLFAKQYGNFPTLDYEIASVRLAAGFYREAAEALKKSFAVKDGLLKTRLAGRASVEAKNFIDLLSLERRAGIFEWTAADSLENADKIKSLLDFSQKVETADANEAAVSEAADEFIKGDDKMKIHRQLFVAGQLLENKKALPKVLDLTKAAISGVDSAFETTNPAAAILADELYDSRTIAIIRGQLIIVPEVPRQTLSSILRGRIEDLSGWSLYQQGKTGEAVVRLKRAVSVLPEKSSWWRNSQWRLGTALDADGKSKEALEAYLKSYANGEPDVARKAVIEAVYQKLNGNLDGLDEKISAKSAAASVEPNAQTTASQSVAQDSVKVVSPIQPSPAPESKAAPDAQISQTAELKAAAQPAAELKSAPESSPTAIVEQTARAAPEKSLDGAVKTENVPVAVSSPETKPEEVPAVLPTESDTKTKLVAEKRTFETDTAKSPKPLFETIVITVPNPKTANPKVQINEKVAQEPDRERVVAEKKSDLPNEEPAQCRITASQESVSLINGGGNLGILIGFEGGAGELKQLAASSSSPKDVEVLLEPEIAAQSGRAFFVVKSISPNKGIYTITFESPCGKKNIPVKVR